MSTQLWIAFLTYAVATAYTPGPNNIISLNTTTKYGFRKSNSLRIGIGVGFTVIMILTNGLAFAIGTTIPGIVNYLKYIGAAYILFLAFKLLISKPLVNEDAKIPKFWTGFFLQFMNIKVILYGFTAVSSFFLPYYSSVSDLLWFCGILILNSQIAIWVWGVLGYSLRKFINKHNLIFNIIMALLLIESAISIVLM